jgi:methyl coenzyme M reductase beta subunit
MRVCAWGDHGERYTSLRHILGNAIGPVALAMAIIDAGAKMFFSSCGLEGEPGAVLGELVRMSAASS